MKLTAQIKLQPSQVQAESLKRTMQATNEAANYASEQAWQNRIFGRVPLQKLVYYDLRTHFGLFAQSACLCVRKVADAYKLDKDSQRQFQPLGSIAYDLRLLTWKLPQSSVSIWTLDGRQLIPFVCGKRQRLMLAHQHGESDLIYRDGTFYLLTTCEIAEAPAMQSTAILGIDLGIVNIATDSDGEIHQGKTVNNVRFRQRKLRQKLQKKGTHSSRRRLKILSGKERRFATWVNHNTSKRIVAKAKDTNRAIAIEELGGIRDRVTARKPQRATLHNWSFAQLRSFIEYKAKLLGVTVIPVDPRNTSRTCPCCGHIAKENRSSQSKFSCVICGFSGLADHIAAVNISRRASVTTPDIPTTQMIV